MTSTKTAGADRDNVPNIVSDMEGDLRGIEHDIRALMGVAEIASDREEPADVPFHIVHVLSGKLMEDYRRLNEKWRRLLTLSSAGGAA